MLQTCSECSKSYDDLDHWSFCPHDYFFPGPGVPQAVSAEPKRWATYLSVTQMFNLREACRVLWPAFGQPTYLVGSALRRVDWRDVDLRCMMRDDLFDAFIGPRYTPRHHFLNTAISEWLSARTGLPIDFQFQRQTEANLEFGDGLRNFMGRPSQPGEAE